MGQPDALDDADWGDPASAPADDGAPLNDREYALLRVLVESRGRVVTRSELARRAGLRHLQPRRVDVLLVNVRRAVGAQHLQNVRGRGWMLTEVPEGLVLPPLPEPATADTVVDR